MNRNHTFLVVMLLLFASLACNLSIRVQQPAAISAPAQAQTAPQNQPVAKVPESQPQAEMQNPPAGQLNALYYLNEIIEVEGSIYSADNSVQEVWSFPDWHIARIASNDPDYVPGKYLITVQFVSGGEVKFAFAEAENIRKLPPRYDPETGNPIVTVIGELPVADRLIGSRTIEHLRGDRIDVVALGRCSDLPWIKIKTPSGTVGYMIYSNKSLQIHQTDCMY